MALPLTLACWDYDRVRALQDGRVRRVEDAQALLGQDWGPYGLEKNWKALETFLRYHYEQGLSRARLSPEGLFAPETLAEFVI